MTEKKTNFHCIKCDYTCSRKFLFDQHIKTNKHFRQCSATPVATPVSAPITTTTEPESVKKNIYGCNYCGKTYKQRSGIWRHKTKCEILNKTTTLAMEESKIGVCGGAGPEMKSMDNNNTNTISKMESSLENTNSDDLKVLMKQNVKIIFVIS